MKNDSAGLWMHFHQHHINRLVIPSSKSSGEPDIVFSFIFLHGNMDGDKSGPITAALQEKMSVFVFLRPELCGYHQ